MNLTFSQGTQKKLISRKQKILIENALKTAATLIKNCPEEIFLSFVSENKIRKIKKKFFNIDQTTDVVAFNYSDNILNAADIIVCPETAKKRCKEFNNTFIRELILYIIHGILHCSGENDTTQEEQKKMRKQEQRIMNALAKKFPELKK